MHITEPIKINLKRNYKEQKKVKLLKSKSCLHHSIAFVIILAQCFGLMPIVGVTSPDVSKIRFKWFSWRTLYASANLFGSIMMLVMNIILYINTGLFFGDVVTIIYFSVVILTLSLFWRIAMKWHAFSEEWYQVELKMKNYAYKPNLSKRFKITTCIVMFLALGEHILFISKLIALVFHCQFFKEDPLKTYFGIAFAHIFSLTSFAFWKAWIIEFLNILATFAWNFMDLFVMLMCASMAEEFRRINRKVTNTKVHDENFWKIIRKDYNRLVLLCNSLDKTINNLISLCLMNDLFFICIQLFNTLKPLKGVVNTIYFIGSFGFLVGRTAAVSLHAAWVNDESKLILAALYNVPSQLFGIEAGRLIKQVSRCPAAITGSNYFEITRDLCLKVGGAILTFEVILQQIGPLILNTEKGSNLPLCLE